MQKHERTQRNWWSSGRRRKAWLLRQTAALLIAVAAGLAALVARSYQWQDVLQHTSDDGRLQSVQSNCGELYFILERDASPLELPHWYHVVRFVDPRFDERFGATASRWPPAKYGSYTSDDGNRFWGVFVPLWFPILVCVLTSIALMWHSLKPTGRAHSAPDNPQ